MKVLIDGDGCPVVDIAVSLCKKYNITCIILCDTAHEIFRAGANTLCFDKGADSVDFALVNRANPGDLVITQDYGLASMCLAKKVRVIHQDGWEYTEGNITALLEQRHAAKKLRLSGKRTKGPKKRSAEQDTNFRYQLDKILQNSVQG